MKKEFKIEVVREWAIWTLFLGASKLPIKKMEKIMNKYWEEWWDVAFQVIEQHRMWLFWTREAAIITFSREVV